MPTPEENKELAREFGEHLRPRLVEALDRELEHVR